MTALDASAVSGSRPELSHGSPAGMRSHSTAVTPSPSTAMPPMRRARRSSHRRRLGAAMTAAITSPTNSSPARVSVP